MKKILFTSESVSEGHPDKICDQISDGILDSALEQDKQSRVACEVFTTNGLVLVGGEITTNGFIDIQNISREIIKDIGYTNPDYGFDYESCAVLVSIHSQCPDIAMGVDTGGAGDQGMMFGFACRETPQLMPLPIMLAHKIVKNLADFRKSKENCRLRPDSKSQVTVEYEQGKPVRIDAVVVSTQHDKEISEKEIKELIIDSIIPQCIDPEMLDEHTKYFVNPTGRFVMGGPAADTGLTGRKIMVDTYGGYSRHGGGAFSGKDPSKVDRSAAYMARYLAKNIVAAELAEKCEIQLAYAIGVKEPVSVMVDTFNTGTVDDVEISKLIREKVDLTPEGIIQRFQLKRPIYKATSVYGHFGREELNFPWELTDLVNEFQV